MGHKEQDINQKGQKGHQECRQQQNQESQEEARRMGGGMEMGCGGQAETDQGQERGDRVNYEDRGERLSSARGQIEIVPGTTDIICMKISHV
jgi:hypothetical protein